MMSLSEGDRVEGRFGGFDIFYPGRVSRVRDNGTFDIIYDDGEFEAGVLPVNLHSVKGVESTDEKTQHIAIGQIVDARCDGGSDYYRGRITRRLSNGSLLVWFEDGGGEMVVGVEMVKPVATMPTSSSSSVVLTVGREVMARFAGRSAHIPGRITSIRPNNTYDIAYDNGKRELAIPRNFILTDDQAESGCSRDVATSVIVHEKQLVSTSLQPSGYASEDDEEARGEPNPVLMASLRDVFDDIDTNRDGVLNVRELIRAVRVRPDIAQMLQLSQEVREGVSRDDFERTFQRMDADDSRDVSWREFVDYFSPAHRHRGRHYKQRLLEARQEVEQEKAKRASASRSRAGGEQKS